MCYLTQDPRILYAQFPCTLVCKAVTLYSHLPLVLVRISLTSDLMHRPVGGVFELHRNRLSGCPEIQWISVTEPVQHAVWAAVPAGRSVWHYRHGNHRSRTVPNLLTSLWFVTRLLLSVSRCFFSWMGGDSGPPLLLDIAYRMLLLPRGRMNLPAVFSRE